MQIVLLLIGFVGPAAVVLLGCVGKLSALLHDGRDVEYFIPGSSLPLSVPLAIGGAIGAVYLWQLIGYRLAGPYKAEWQALQKVGTGGKAGRAFTYIFCGIGLIGILGIPLYLDCYMKVTDRGIVINTITEFRKRSYGWRDVRNVGVIARGVQDHGHHTTRLTYRVDFTDGKRWSVQEGNALPDEVRVMEKAVQFIATKTGKQIRYD